MARPLQRRKVEWRDLDTGKEHRSRWTAEEKDADAVQRAVVINEALAKTYFPGENPVGRSIGTLFVGGKETTAEVIGVVRNVLHYGLRKPVEPALYFAFSAAPWSPSFLLRMNQGAAFSGADIRRAISSLDPQARIGEIRTLDDRVNDYLNRERLLASISVAFGIIALVLAAVGLYGVMAYGVTRRSREIGLRMALGAHRAQVLRMVLRMVLRDAAFIAIAGISGWSSGRPGGIADRNGAHFRNRRSRQTLARRIGRHPRRGGSVGHPDPRPPRHAHRPDYGSPIRITKKRVLRASCHVHIFEWHAVRSTWYVAPIFPCYLSRPAR
jgi:hypothetical protein